MIKSANLSSLNMHLFAELERLDDEETQGEDLKAEIDRAEAICKVSTQIIQNAAVVLKGAQLQAEYGKNSALQDMIGLELKE